MEISELRNPYDYANPVKDPALFAGRNNALAKIGYLLDQGGFGRPTSYVAVHGKRAAGKTSLLNIAELMAQRKGYIAVRVDLVMGDSSAVNFFSKVYIELIRAVGQTCDLKLSNGQDITPRLVRRIIQGQYAPDDAFPLEFPETLACAVGDETVSEMALREDLEYLAEQSGKPIALFIDEAQVIAGQENILSILRTVGMRLQGYVFIMAGTADLVPTINGVFGHLLRQFELVSVERFVEEVDAVTCISLPLISLGLTPTDCFENLKSTASDLMHLTDGNPYEIQLYCHVMFTRWQNGTAQNMELSTQLLDDVQTLLEARTGPEKRLLLAKIRSKSVADLTGLNIACSSLGHATVDEIWAAHSLYGQSGMSRADLDSQFETLIEESIIEIDNGRVKFRGDQFEEIFIRLWTLQKIKKKHRHLELLGHLDFRHILTRNLEYLLCDIRPPGLQILPTCCWGMDSVHLQRGLAHLADLPKDGSAHYTIAYLHEAIVRSGMPAALDLTEVTCTFNGTKAVRWVYAPGDTQGVDIGEIDSFRRAADRMRDLDGELRASRDRIILRPWPEILEWITSQGISRDAHLSKGSQDDATRRGMSEHHISAGIEAYSTGDLNLAVSHLESAFALNNSWSAANNLAYIMLKIKEYDKSLEWSKRALDLHQEPQEFALSSYNAAMAEAELGNYDEARSRLAGASAKLEEFQYRDYFCYYLMLPGLEDGKTSLHEESGVNLPVAVAKAMEIVDLVVRLKKISGLLN